MLHHVDPISVRLYSFIWEQCIGSVYLLCVHVLNADWAKYTIRMRHPIMLIHDIELVRHVAANFTKMIRMHALVENIIKGSPFHVR